MEWIPGTCIVNQHHWWFCCYRLNAVGRAWMPTLEWWDQPQLQLLPITEERHLKGNYNSPWDYISPLLLAPTRVIALVWHFTWSALKLKWKHNPYVYTANFKVQIDSCPYSVPRATFPHSHSLHSKEHTHVKEKKKKRVNLIMNLNIVSHSFQSYGKAG